MRVEVRDLHKDGANFVAIDQVRCKTTCLLCIGPLWIAIYRFEMRDVLACQLESATDLKKLLNKGSWSLWNRNVPLRAQPRSRHGQLPFAAWLNPKSNQHAMHDGSEKSGSHRRESFNRCMPNSVRF